MWTCDICQQTFDDDQPRTVQRWWDTTFIKTPTCCRACALTAASADPDAALDAFDCQTCGDGPFLPVTVTAVPIRPDELHRAPLSRLVCSRECDHAFRNRERQARWRAKHQPAKGTRTKTCQACGEPFETQRAHATYCGATCRKRASRQ